MSGINRTQLSGMIRMQFSRDLPQGGLDVPCLLICIGDIADVKKLHKLTEQLRAS